jgi:hypothetical protein
MLDQLIGSGGALHGCCIWARLWYACDASREALTGEIATYNSIHQANGRAEHAVEQHMTLAIHRRQACVDRSSQTKLLAKGSLHC